MALTFCIILLGHLAGDFYAQSDRLAKAKTKNKRACAKHCLTYALWMLVPTAFLVVSGAGLLHAVAVFAVLGLSHALVDALLKPPMAKIMNEGLALFTIDQLTHLVFITACALCIAPEVGLIYDSEPVTVALLLIVLLCCKPISVVVKLVLERTRKVENDGGYQSGTTEVREPDGAGSVIGILERLIIALLTWLGQYEAIAFVIAAKSIARFKKLEDQDFAETYLIGTLTSVLLAMLATLGIKTLLL